MKSFASDNWSGVSREIIQKIIEVNNDHSAAYGGDEYTESVIKKFGILFGKAVKVYFVTSGTAANTIGLASIVKQNEGVISSVEGHINVDECGAFERFTGAKILPVPSYDGKIKIDDINKYIKNIGNPHKNQPKVIYISQATERETLYSVKEIREIADFAHKNGMYLFIDGARIANACVALNTTVKEMITDTGVDMVTFGGTKNGAMMAEAIVVLNDEIGQDLKFIQKQGFQLNSKSRFLAAQFDALLTDDLWIKNATIANQMAKKLQDELRKIPEIKITIEVVVNAVYCCLPKGVIGELSKEYPFHIWNDETGEVRLMCSFDTTEEDIDEFVCRLRGLLR